MTEERTLEELRTQIDDIDRYLLELFCTRMELAAGIAEYKRNHDLPTLRPEREQEILDRAEKQAGSVFAEYARRFFIGLMELSRDYQDELRNNEDSE